MDQDRAQIEPEDEAQAGLAGENGSSESALVGEGVGARVTAVFTAAEKASEHILSLAREEAEDLRRRVHAEVEAYRQECRNAAEQEAQRVIEGGHDRAREIEREAKAGAAELERAGREKRNRLLEETHLLQERIEWAREGLREVLLRLEQVEEPGAEPPGRESTPA